MSKFLFRTVTTSGYSFLSQIELNQMGSMGWRFVYVTESKVGQQYIFEKAENKWEYKTEVVKPDHQDAVLNQLGEESWELVSAINIVLNSAPYVKLYFKRSK